MAKKSMKEIHEDLDDVLTTLTEDVTKALDIKEERKLLEKKIRQLKNEEIELREVVEHLKNMRDKMQEELKKKEAEEEELLSKINALKEDKAALEAEKISLNQQIKNLKKEKELAMKSLEKTNDMLIALKHQIAEFDKEIRG
jgi:chromosome segregation ATPase